MDNDRSQILRMLAEGKITADEAERLLDALAKPAGEVSDRVESSPKNKKPKYLKVEVNPRHGCHRKKVNVRIPLQLIRAGVKLTSLMPDSARDKVGERLKEKGIDLDLTNIKSDDLDNLFDALVETNIDVDEEDERVRIYCE